MLRAGVPVKVASQCLGHADIAVTMRVYDFVTTAPREGRDQVFRCGAGGNRTPVRQVGIACDTTIPRAQLTGAVLLGQVG